MISGEPYISSDPELWQVGLHTLGEKVLCCLSFTLGGTYLAHT